MDEWEFETRLCATLEATQEALVARQLGAGIGQPGNRIVDVVLVTPGPDIEERVRLTDRSIPARAIAS